MKKLFVIFTLVVSTLLAAQNAVWENPKPFVLGDNIELQLPSIKTSDGNTIFFWSKTELEGRIMYATKLNELGEYLWSEEKKIILEHTPAVWLEEITEIAGNNFVLHFSHTDYKNGPFDNIYNIMDENGNILWNDSFSLLDYNDELYQISLFKDIISGFNILCHNQSNDESKIIHFDFNGNYTEFDVSNYLYANLATFSVIPHNDAYYILYVDNGNLIYAKLNNNYELVNTSIIPLNITVCTNDRIHLYPYENEFYIIEEFNEIVCKISENGELIWLTNWNIDRSYNHFHQGITIDGKIFIFDIYNDQVHFIVINNDGEIEVEIPILQDEDILQGFHVSYNDNNKINVISASYEDDTYYYLAQIVDLDGTMTYPIEGLQLDISPKNFHLVLASYPDKFSCLFLQTGEDRKTYLEINTYNESGTQIIPEDQTILESSFVSLSWMDCSQYIEDENNILVAFVSNRAGYWAGEVYIQKIDQSGNLLYEEEGRYLNTYYTHEVIRDVFINEDGFVFIIYRIFDDISYLKCDIFDNSGEFVRTYLLDTNVSNYAYVYHHFTESGVIVGWKKNNTIKILKLNQNELLWDNPISKTFPTSNGLDFKLTDNYLLCDYYESPGYAKFLYKFDDDGSFSPGWLNGFNLNNIENLSWISRVQQANDNFYFTAQIFQVEYQLLGIDSNQQILFDDLNITMPYSGFGIDLLIDENIYLAYQDTIQQTVTVDKLDMAGQNIWSNNTLSSDPSYFYGIGLQKSSTNSISVITTHTENFRFASMDLDGNLVTPPDGNIIADGRGEKRLIDTHEMDNGQFLITWDDYCVGNILDGDGIGYNSICGQLYDFSALSNDENTIPSSCSYQLSNFPNPFNPETTISFSIPNDSEIELTVYNIKGQKVKALLKDNFEKGVQSIVWDGFDDSFKPVSSGIYLYKLNVNEETVAVKKCLLLK